MSKEKCIHCGAFVGKRDECGQVYCTKCGEYVDDDPGDNNYINDCGGEW